MKRITELLLVALIAAALVGGGMWANAAFTTFGPPVTNDFTKVYFQELRGFKVVAAAAGVAGAGSPTTVTGMEAGDVIIDVVNWEAIMTSVSEGAALANIDESIYTAGAGVATLSTSGGAPTEADRLVFFFVDIDNTN